MMTQNMKVQVRSLFTGTSTNDSVKGKKAGNDFELFINSSLRSEQTGSTKVTADRKETVKKNSVADNAAEDSSASTKTQTDKAQNSSKSETLGAVDKTSDIYKEDKVNDSVADVDTSSEEELTAKDEIITQINALLQSIQEVVMKVLNLTSEELNQMLEEQGLSLTDLLETQNLQQFILTSNGQNSILATLTNEKLANDMNKLLQTVDQLKTDSNIGLSADQIKSMLAEMKQLTETASHAVNAEIITDFITNQNKEAIIKPEAVDTVQKKDDAVIQDNIKSATENTGKFEQEALMSTEEKQSDAKPSADRDGEQSYNTSEKYQTFIENLAKTAQNAQVNSSEDVAKLTKLREIATQIIERIKVSVTADKTSMELQLNPENLGKVNLTVQTKNGVMTAHFVVQNEISKEAIESQIHTLRETLEEQGIKVNAIEVTVSANAFEQGDRKDTDNQPEAQKNSNNGRQISLEEALSMSETTEEDTSRSDVTGMRGSLVDYTA